MTVATFGNHVQGQLTPLSPEVVTLGESVVGQIYQLDFETDGIPNPQLVLDTLLVELPKKEPTAKILWMQADNNKLSMQILGSPFIWTIVIGAIAGILALVGVNNILGGTVSQINQLTQQILIIAIVGVAAIIGIWLLTRGKGKDDNDDQIIVVK